MIVIYYGILFLMVMGAGTLQIMVQMKKSVLKWLLAFSGAYLLTITIFHVLPEIYGGGHTHDHESHINPGIFVLAGFFLQIVLDIFSRGIEHGHIHLHHGKNKLSQILPITASLYIHSFIEGIPLHDIESDTFQPLFWGIILHNLPITVAYMAMVSSAGCSKAQSWMLLAGFALMTPLGAFTGSFIYDNHLLESAHQMFLAIAAGIFLHISTTIIFETGEDHTYNYRKMIAIVTGVVLAILSLSI